MRLVLATLLGLLCLAPVAQAGEEPLAGNWKVTIHQESQQINFWLISFTSNNGKWSAEVETLDPKVPPTTLDKLAIDGDRLRFALRLRDNATFDFEGRMPKPGAKKIFGSLSRGTNPFPTILEATPAKNAFELNRELLVRTPNDPRAMNIIFNVISQAKENKVAPKDLQEWMEGSLKAAELYGPRWQSHYTLALIEALQKQSDYSSLAVDLARKAEKLLDPSAPLDAQLKLLTVLASSLRNSKNLDEAKAVESRIDALEGKAFAEHEKAGLGYDVTRFAGRKAKSERAVLVELFTGAQCPPCVAADVGFDGLARRYSPKEVVLLQYHMHIPAPEPLSNADSDARFEYYADSFPKAVRGTPAILFNGKPDAPGGGGKEEGAEKFKEYSEVIDRLLEQPTTVQISTQAVRKDDVIEISAKVSGIEAPADKIRLRLALVEDWARFAGRNGLVFHQRVVRATPGGAKGIAVDKRDFSYATSVKLADLRASLNAYLDDTYGQAVRPMRLRDLHVVAFVQNDSTSEVMHAVEVEVR